MTSLRTRPIIRCLKTSSSFCGLIRLESRSLWKSLMCQPGSSKPKHLVGSRVGVILELKPRKPLDGDVEELPMPAMRLLDGDEVRVAGRGGGETLAPSLPLEAATSPPDQTLLAPTLLIGVQWQQHPASLPSARPPAHLDPPTVVGAHRALPIPLQVPSLLHLQRTQIIPSSHGNQLLRQVVGNLT